MRQPQLQHFTFLLICQLSGRLRQLVVVNQPISVVNRMDCHEVTIVVRGALMKDHSHNAVAGFGNDNPIIGVRDDDICGHFQGSVMFCPLLFMEFEALKMKNQAVGLSIKKLALFIIRPLIDESLKRGLVFFRREDDIDGNLSTFFQNAIASNVKELAANALRFGTGHPQNHQRQLVVSDQIGTRHQPVQECQSVG